MNHMRDEILIQAPVKHVWDFMLNTSRWPDWRPRAECSNFSGPVDQVGTTWDERWRLLGFEMKDTTRVVEVEPLRLIRMGSEQYKEDTYLRFEPEGEATRLVIESDWEMPGHLPAFIQDLMSKAWMERNVRHMLEDVKALAEAKVAVPA